MTPTLWDVVVIGGGAAGIAAAASLLKRKPHLSVAIVEPNDRHFYQPAWTLVVAVVSTRPIPAKPPAN